jgi:hypothetical protein
VLDCVTAAKDCLAADNVYGAYEVLSGLSDPDERTWAWTFFDSKQRRAIKEQAALAKEAAPTSDEMEGKTIDAESIAAEERPAIQQPQSKRAQEPPAQPPPASSSLGTADPTGHQQPSAGAAPAHPLPSSKQGRPLSEGEEDKPLSDGARKALEAQMKRAARTEADLIAAGHGEIVSMKFSAFNGVMAWLKNNPAAS